MAQGKKANGPKKPRGIPALILAAEKYRLSIDAPAILKRLKQHIEGEVKMLPTQVKAAEILLKKCMPDLSSMELNVDGHLDATVTVVSFADLRYDGEGNPILNSKT